MRQYLSLHKGYLSKKSQEKVQKIEKFERDIHKLLNERLKGKGIKVSNEKDAYDLSKDILKKNKDKVVDEKYAQFTKEDYTNLEIYIKKVDSYVGDECILCGNVFIEILDMPFDALDEVNWAL